jgi:hypothetical protein
MSTQNNYLTHKLTFEKRLLSDVGKIITLKLKCVIDIFYVKFLI